MCSEASTNEQQLKHHYQIAPSNLFYPESSTVLVTYTIYFFIMRYQIILATLLASACANPVALSKRKEETYDKKGNLRLQCKSSRGTPLQSKQLTTSALVSKTTVKIGSIELDDIFDKLNDACGTNLCDTNEIEIKGQIHDKETTDNIKLTLGPDGEYSENMRDKLFDAWKAAVKEIADCKDVTNDPPCANPMAYCPDNSDTYTQCEVSAAVFQCRFLN